MVFRIGDRKRGRESMALVGLRSGPAQIVGLGQRSHRILFKQCCVDGGVRCTGEGARHARVEVAGGRLQDSGAAPVDG